MMTTTTYGSTSTIYIGQIDLSIYDAVQKQLVWRGTASKTLDPKAKPATIDLLIDYLRPGRGNFFIATGRVVRLGGRVAVAHMELVNDTGDQIATGSAAYIVG